MNDDPLRNNLYWMLLQVAFRSKHGLMKLAEKHDLTVVQLHSLGVMNPGEPIPMNMLSNLLLCDASNVTGIVDDYSYRNGRIASNYPSRSHCAV
jgi:DNA-binding MarR family transcriptional regulator